MAYRETCNHVVRLTVILWAFLATSCRREEPKGVEAAPPPIAVEGDAGPCGTNGRFSAVKKDGTCPAIPLLSELMPIDISWGLGPGYRGPLGRCPDSDPFLHPGYKFRFRIDRVDESSRTTEWHGANLDFPGFCGVAVEFESPTGEKPMPGVGTVVILAHRSLRRDFEDGAAARGIFDEKGALLYGLIEGEDLSRYMKDFGDFFPGLNVGGLTRTVCRSVDVELTLGAIKLSTPNGPSCELDSHSRGCCELWGGQYEIHGHGIVAPGKRNPSINMGFAIRAQGFFLSRN